ncbi:MAG: deoxyribose-phosphate aldolase [Solirubrobacteraceae bacterium]|nr:deoxyribose-phosphate aldolase [Solirubrobacteraceae bacterium]
MPPHRASALLDLTTLTGQETDEEIDALCERAARHGVAAVCVYGRYVARAAGHGVRVAAVANFPEGDLDADRAARESAAAVDAGAQEVDVVLPWRAWLDGDSAGALQVVEAARNATPGTLKVILESGRLGDRVREAADAALAGGADFVKTSTGKVGPGASPEAARAMLEAVRDHGSGGFKASGGVRTREHAEAYLAIADELLGPDWATPQTFRIGASSLLDVLLDEDA